MDEIEASIDPNSNIAHYCNYSTSNIFYAIRLAIVKGDIDYNKIVFLFEDKEIHVNQYGYFRLA
jgi:hypothetical protein